MDDGVQQPKPRAAARPSRTTARPSGPADPRTEGSGDRRPARPMPSPTTARGAVPSVILPTVGAGTVVPDADPAVVDGTPVVLPRIIPAEPEPEPARPPVRAPVTVAVPGGVAVPEPDAEIDGSADGTGGLPSMLRPQKAPRALRPPVLLRRPSTPRVRRVTRVVRQIDTWSVFKVSIVFSIFLYVVCLTAGVLLWQVAQNTGTIDNVERFFESFGWQTFQLKGGEIYHQAWVGGLFAVVGLTGLAVLTATMFNLIADLVGGIRVTVLEEEVVARADRGLGWRRAHRDEPAPADSSHPSEPFDTADPGAGPPG